MLTLNFRIPMKPTKSFSGMLVAGLSLLMLPLAWAGDAAKKFEKMDANGDGKVSRVEHSGAAERMFAEMDTDGDRIVTVAELKSKKTEHRGDQGRHEISAAEKIRAVDENGDGRVTAAEHASRSDDLFDEMDANNDRMLSRQEVEAGHTMLKKK